MTARAVLVVVEAAAIGGTLATLRRTPRLARACAIGAVSLLVVGWGLAQYPMLIAPDLTVDNAAAPHATLRAVMPVVVGGAVLLVPSLWWMLRVFKR